MRRIGVLISFRKSDHEAGSLVAEFREVDCRDARLVDLPERGADGWPLKEEAHGSRHH